MISGFQNYLHLLYGLPNGWLARSTDTSDILNRGLKKHRKRAEELLEEAIAAQLLKQQQQNIEIPETVDKDLLIDVLKDKLYATPKMGEVAGKTRTQRIKVLLMLLALEDE